MIKKSQMIKKAVILAGGLGTRISEESHLRPKPMVEIGGKPILWHIMNIFSMHGINDFIICVGYKGYIIKEYFNNYYLHTSDVTYDMRTNSQKIHQSVAEPWRVTLVDTGEDTLTGGRLKRIRPYLDDEDFCFTYGDGVSDINIVDLMRFHKQEGRLATVTSVRPQARFGSIIFDEKKIIKRFEEKPQDEGGWINGGFFVLSPKVLDYIEGDNTPWEADPMHRLVSEHQLSAYQHHGFWHAMDTLRDKNYLNELWLSGKAPWKMWT